MVRSLRWSRSMEWFLDGPDDTTYDFDFTEDGWTLFREWVNAPMTDDYTISGVLADWWEENMPPSPLSVRFVARLREQFHSRGEVGT